MTRILFIADGRSPTALNWIRHFVDKGHEVHLATTFDSKVDLKLASLTFIPVAGSRAEKSEVGKQAPLKRYLPLQLRTKIKQYVGPLTLRRSAKELRKLAEKIQPDLVHAMRIPFEGMLASEAALSAPLISSVWGNDFTLHAASNPMMARATRNAICRTDALHSDTQRDQDLALEWGFDPVKNSIVLPGNGGIRSEIFYPLPEASEAGKIKARIHVINPRGIRAYMRNDTFFKAIPLVLRKRPEVRFLCPSMEGEAEAEKWVRDLNLDGYVQLMPRLGPRAMADAYHSSQVMVSPSAHDGTPNTLLEAMACGVFPVVGDIESVREWIKHGENGFLADIQSPENLANSIIAALKKPELRAKAARMNIKIISERAEYGSVMRQAEDFYERVLSEKAAN